MTNAENSHYRRHAVSTLANGAEVVLAMHDLRAVLVRKKADRLPDSDDD